MGTTLGRIVDAVLVRGLLTLEAAYPMPARLGMPLPLGAARRAGADPVVLVGGFANSVSGWDEWKRSLEADGFRVFVFDPPTVGLGDMEQAARDVAAFLEEVRRRTGRQRVDVVGFSEGGVLARMAARYHGQASGIDRLVSLATPHAGVAARAASEALRGSRLLRDATPQAAIQLLAGSALLRRIEIDDRDLRLARGAAGAPRYASVFSISNDLFVTPWSSWLEGATNVPVRRDSGRLGGPNHFEMLHSSDRAYEAARLLLLDRPAAEAVTTGMR